MALRKSNPAFLNGVPEMLVLKLLAERAMHGYDLVQAIKAVSREGLAFGEGCIYPILHRLEAERLLRSSKEEVSGRVRVVYRATARGKARLAETVSNWRQVVDSINCALEGGSHGQPAMA
jgi:PadR family transcriptional regulator PadR